MENTVLEQGNGTAAVEQSQDNVTRTFTQEELDSIIANRLKKESAKYSDYEELKKKASEFEKIEEAKKTELQKATEKADALQKELDAINKANEVRTVREKVANEKGIPSNLLTGDTEEACIEQADNILAFVNSGQSYPSIKDGGEVLNTNKKKSEADLFADWFAKTTN